MKVTSYYFEDTRESFKKEGRVNEDVLLVKDNIFAVFDGVTLLHQSPYPNPSPAKIVAEVGANSVIEYIGKNEHGESGIKTIKKAFDHANKKVKEYNDSLGITKDTLDYINTQYAATTCSFGFIKDTVLYFSQLNDCGVMVFDQERNMEVDFILNQTPYINLLTKLEGEKRFEPGSIEEHIYVRRDVVNNKDLEFEGKRINFGVMTGEESVSEFAHYGAAHLFSGQLILFYTDGFLPFVYDKNFIELLFETNEREIIEQYIVDKHNEGDKFKKNKSLIVIKT